MKKEKWHNQAANVLKGEMARVGVNYVELVKRLQAMGLDESYSSVSSKINRGTYSFVFFMQCMKAIKVKQISL